MKGLFNLNITFMYTFFEIILLLNNTRLKATEILYEDFAHG